MSVGDNSRLYELGKTNELVMISDAHAGADDFCEKSFIETIKYIQSSDARLALNGDIIENATAGDKSPGSKLLDQAWRPTEQFKWVRSKLLPLAKAGKILWVIEGNHEQRSKRQALIDLSEILADSLDVPYLLHGGMVRLIAGREKYDGAVQHGTSGGKNVYMELDRMCAMYPSAEFVALGHNHQLCHRAVGSVALDKRTNREVFKECHQIRTGTYLSYANYARLMLVSPTKIGSPIIKFGPKKHKIHVDCEKLSY